MQSDKKTALSMIALGVFMIAGLIQIINWDKYSLTVIPLEASVRLGYATAQDYSRYSKICLERKKYECAHSYLQKYTELEPTNLEARLELGLLQLRMNDLNSAVNTLSAYIQDGGEEPKARFHLAKAHSQLNNTGEALKIYRQLLKGRTDVFQVSVTREYIQTLIQAKKWNQAKSSIEKARRQSLTHNAFMTAEYKAVLNKIRPK